MCWTRWATTPPNVLDLRDATQAQMVATFGNEKSAEGDLWAYLDPAGGSDIVVFYSGHGVPGQRDGKGHRQRQRI